MQLKGRETLTHTKLVSRKTWNIRNTAARISYLAIYKNNYFYKYSGTLVMSSQEEEKVDRVRDVTLGVGFESQSP